MKRQWKAGWLPPDKGAARFIAFVMFPAVLLPFCLPQMQAAADDLTQLGPKGESEARKRQRIAAMTHKLTSVLAALREQQQEAGEAAEAASEAKPEASSPTAQQSSGPPSNAAADGGHAAAAADEGQQQDEGGALKRVVKAAVQETMPDAVPGTLQDAGMAAALQFQACLLHTMRIDLAQAWCAGLGNQMHTALTNSLLPGAVHRCCVQR